MNIINLFLSTFERTIYKKNTGNKVIPITDVMSMPFNYNMQVNDIETGLFHGGLGTNPFECRINIRYDEEPEYM